MPKSTAPRATDEQRAELDRLADMAQRRGYWSGTPRTNVTCLHQHRNDGVTNLCRHVKCIDAFKESYNTVRGLDHSGEIDVIRLLGRPEVIVKGVWLDPAGVDQLRGLLDSAQVVHFVPNPGDDWMCACGWDVQDLPQAESWSTSKEAATCNACLS